MTKVLKEVNNMLTERQLLILNLIIQHYIQHGEPLGSKSLLKEANLPVSPATIRNDMMRLEELGLLGKTHTSSGRVPSILGYRYYVDYLLKQEQMDAAEELRHTVQESLRNPYKEAQEIVELSAEMLSQLTNYTALSIGPETTNSRLTGFRLVPITKGQYMAILVTDKGYVESKIFALPLHLEAPELEKIVRIFNEELVGLRLVDVHQQLRTEIPLIVKRYVEAEIDLSSIFQEILRKMDSERVYVGGGMNLLNYIDKSMDREQVKEIYSLLHQSADLVSFLPKEGEDLAVRIGSEMNNELFESLSLIMATYDSGRGGKGVIALLGPTNMPYRKILSIMRLTRDVLSDSMNEFYQ